MLSDDADCGLLGLPTFPPSACAFSPFAPFTGLLGGVGSAAFCSLDECISEFNVHTDLLGISFF